MDLDGIPRSTFSPDKGCYERTKAWFEWFDTPDTIHFTTDVLSDDFVVQL